MRVSLDEEQSNDLQKYIFDIAKKSIDAALRTANLDKPFLKQKYTAEWLGISINTLKSWENQGLPSIMIDGVKFFSREEVTKWVLSYQK
ncbi:hypothetical protein [Brochothrix thermosphacta]|uniref:hypothetical protein n=1 Tax=Brochothrix thermosphacta TaxID=2756 RepID=UPI00083F6BA4|nr:hypothetical protein [Brochothrix thermosphacta]ATH85786.1 DNA-binding protein [Brochothrix thermosphacta]MDO7864445.1 hypothetical protein [Brochothrix thermosphacta]MPQ29670.1 DNA-binding protein [Brochothrix thermosphacta]ODJ58238.1 hypothetical protein BFR44_08715 [Brochothrix thermosphacta]